MLLLLTFKALTYNLPNSRMKHAGAQFATFTITLIVSERRWKLVLMIKSDESSDDNEEANESMLSAYCADLYIPVSPQKA